MERNMSAKRALGPLSMIFLMVMSVPCSSSREGEIEDNPVGLFYEEPDICLSNYDVSEGRIIRTKDSQNLGAHFLNESDVSGSNSREVCLRLCCRTPHCNVIVLEEKNTWSCYLFDCGPPEDFRCKFTPQIHYMSAILRRREVILNKHESELSELRNPEMDKMMENKGQQLQQALSEQMSKRKQEDDDAKSPNDPMADNMGSRSTRGCDPGKQFECKSTGECIAIYNTCDKIVHCPDRSDEDPVYCTKYDEELKSRQGGVGPMMKQPLGEDGRQSLPVSSSSSDRDLPLSVFAHKTQGVMDENFGNQPPHHNYWKNYDYQTNNAEYQTNRYSPSSQSNPGLGGGRSLGNFGGGFPQNSPNQFNPNMPLQQQQQQQQQFFNSLLNPNNYGNFNGPPSSSVDVQQSPNNPPIFNNNLNYPQIYQGPGQQQHNQIQPNINNAGANYNSGQLNNPQIAKPTTTLAPSTTPAPTTQKSDLVKVEAILASMKKTPLQVEELGASEDEHSAGIGAVLIFIMGLGMTLVMAFIVGCRLRRVGTRSRRGKNRLDPDYLVDGMYL